MAGIRSYENTSCLKCGAVNHKMVYVGPMIFCHKCFYEEFIIPLFAQVETIANNCKEYIKWIELYRERGIQ